MIMNINRPIHILFVALQVQIIYAGTGSAWRSREHLCQSYPQLCNPTANQSPNNRPTLNQPQQNPQEDSLQLFSQGQAPPARRRPPPNRRGQNRRHSGERGEQTTRRPNRATTQRPTRRPYYATGTTRKSQAFERTTVKNDRIQKSGTGDCIKARGHTECFVYDPSRAALTLEEAMVNFHSLRAQYEQPGSAHKNGNVQFSEPQAQVSNLRTTPLDDADELMTSSRVQFSSSSRLLGNQQNGPSITHNKELCAQSAECLGCARALLNLLSSNLVKMEGQSSSDTEVLRDLRQFHSFTCSRLNVTDVSRLPLSRQQSANCEKFLFGSPTINDPFGQDEFASPFGRSNSFNNNLVMNLTDGRIFRLNQGKGNIQTAFRDAPLTEAVAPDPSRLSSCVEKGTPLSTGSQQHRLCSSCMSIRILGNDYIPKLIQEEICNTEDLFCINGHAECRNKMLYQQVLRKVQGDQGQTEYLLDHTPVRFSCECVVPSNSAMFHIIRR